MSEWEDQHFAGLVAKGHLRIEMLPDGTPTYRQTAKGAEAYRENMRRLAHYDEQMTRLHERAHQD